MERRCAKSTSYTNNLLKFKFFGAPKMWISNFHETNVAVVSLLISKFSSEVLCPRKTQFYVCTVNFFLQRYTVTSNLSYYTARNNALCSNANFDGIV